MAMTPDDENTQDLVEFLMTVLSAEDLGTALKIIGGEDADDAPGTSLASDSRNKGYTDMSTNEAVKEIRALYAAEAAVRPFVGAMDTAKIQSAGGVYIAALKTLGHDTKGLDSRAAKAIFDVVKNNGVKRTLATDSRVTDAMNTRFPGVAALKQR